MSNFYLEVIKKSPRYLSKQRVADLALLEPNMRRKVEAILKDAKGNGLDLMVFETYRSKERQKQLFAQGVTKLKNVGVHHYGLACDLVRVHNGEPSWDGDFSLVGHLAKAHALIWGGDWGTPDQHHTFIDAPHVQWCSVKDQTKLMNGTWYPDASYNPYEHL